MSQCIFGLGWYRFSLSIKWPWSQCCWLLLWNPVGPTGPGIVKQQQPPPLCVSQADSLAWWKKFPCRFCWVLHAMLRWCGWTPRSCLLGLEYPLYPSLVFPAGCSKSRLDETVSLLLRRHLKIPPVLRFWFKFSRHTTITCLWSPVLILCCFKWL